MVQEKDIRIPYDECMAMTVKQIRQTKAYKLLTPLGKLNRSGSYRYGNKSTLRKRELCIVLDDPQKYHKKIKNLKDRKINAGPRRRSTRKGNCVPKKRLPPCNTQPYVNQGLTTTGKDCCYKKQQSDRVRNQRKRD
jgi:hypothetical protein